MYIDETYFTKRLNLPQRGNTEGIADILDYVEQYEPEYLKCVLGAELWQAFNVGTDGSGPPSDVRWSDLLLGKDFSYKNCAYHWVGFAPASKISPIANYVFWQYVDAKIAEVVLTGVVVSETDNNRTVPATDVLVDAWNRMVDMNLTLYRFLKANASTYPEFKLCFDVNQFCLPDYPCACGCEDCGPHPCSKFFRKINSLGL